MTETDSESVQSYGLRGHDWSENPVTVGRFSTRFNCCPSAPIVQPFNRVQACCQPIRLLRGGEGEYSEREREREIKIKAEGVNGKRQERLRLEKIKQPASNCSVHEDNTTELRLKEKL